MGSVLSDRSQGPRREITGITTLDEAKEALAMLTRLGVAGDAEIHGYLHVGWTGRPTEELEEGVDSDPDGRPASLGLWAMTEASGE